MARLEDYYNEGSVVSSRHDAKKVKDIKEKAVKLAENDSNRLETLQEEWLNIDNPLLWDGEID